ncbi:hypothetical protein BH23VER1_BH23VER1_20080 [soil metagenome]
MIMKSSKLVLTIFTVGMCSLLGLAPLVAGPKSMRLISCEELAHRLAVAAQQDPQGAAAAAGAAAQARPECALDIARAVFAALGADSPYIPDVVYELAKAAPDSAAAIAEAAIAVSPNQSAAIRRAASRGVRDAGQDGFADFGPRPIDITGPYLIAPSAPTGPIAGEGPVTVITETRTVTRTVSGGTRTVVVSPAGVGG